MEKLFLRHLTCADSNGIIFDDRKNYKIISQSELNKIQNQIKDVTISSIDDKDIVFLGDTSYPKLNLKNIENCKIKRTIKLEKATKIVIDIDYLPSINDIGSIPLYIYDSSHYGSFYSSTKIEDPVLLSVSTLRSELYYITSSNFDSKLKYLNNKDKLVTTDALIAYLNKYNPPMDEEELDGLVNLFISNDSEHLSLGLNIFQTINTENFISKFFSKLTKTRYGRLFEWYPKFNSDTKTKYFKYFIKLRNKNIDLVELYKQPYLSIKDKQEIWKCLYMQRTNYTTFITIRNSNDFDFSKASFDYSIENIPNRYIDIV